MLQSMGFQESETTEQQQQQRSESLDQHQALVKNMCSPRQINVSVITLRKNSDGLPGQIHSNPVFTVDFH